MRIHFLCFIAFAAVIGTSTHAAADDDARWPSWRGIDGTRVVSEGNPPLHWSETKNIKWKTRIPGDGQSTPIIWDDKIILQTAEPLDAGVEEKVPVYKFSVLCVNRGTGAILWQTVVREARPHEGHHKTTSVAPFSPVTDGERIWASFGSQGLFCLTMDGKVLWEAKTIPMKKLGKFGEGSSPILVDDAIIVLADHEGQSKIFAFNKDTGAIIWERNRDVESSWNTPTAVKVGDRTEIITTAPKSIHSYDAATGELIWHSGGLTSGATPSALVSNGLVYCTTGYKGEALMAIELGHTGDLTGTKAVRWFVDTTGASVPTPLIHDGRLYVFKGYNGIISCYDAATGASLYERQRIKGIKTVYASPLAVGDNIYLCGRSGTTVIIKSSNEFEIIATNKLDDVLDASPVVIGDELYLRGRSHLYCIADAGASE